MRKQDARLSVRHQSEQEFWDRHIREKRDRYRPYRFWNELDSAQLFSRIPMFRSIPPFFGDLAGKRIVEIGCGTGWVSLYFARSGASVFACDISPSMVKIARQAAALNGLADRAFFSVMAGEALAYPSSSMDFVFMNAALHHCDVEPTIAEVHRVLRDKGRAVFMEDFAYHPLLHIYRCIRGRRHTEHERALTAEDLSRISRRFRRLRVEYHQLLDIFPGPVFLKRMLDRVDRVLLVLPFLRKYCRLVGIFAEK